MTITDLCTWCGHGHTSHPCPRHINDHNPKTRRPCPCNRYRRRDS